MRSDMPQIIIDKSSYIYVSQIPVRRKQTPKKPHNNLLKMHKSLRTKFTKVCKKLFYSSKSQKPNSLYKSHTIATEREKLLKIVLNIREKFKNLCANHKIILLKRQKNLHCVKVLKTDSFYEFRKIAAQQERTLKLPNKYLQKIQKSLYECRINCIIKKTKFSILG